MQRARRASGACAAGSGGDAHPDQNITTVSTGGSHTVAVRQRRAMGVGPVGKDVTAQALGEKLGSGHLRAHAGEWFTLAVVIPPRPEDEEDFENLGRGRERRGRVPTC